MSLGKGLLAEEAMSRFPYYTERNKALETRFGRPSDILPRRLVGSESEAR